MALPERDGLRFRTSGKYARGLWCDVDQLPTLAFDHKGIIEVCVDRIRAKLNYTTIALLLLPQEFTLTELQSVYEYCLGKQLDKRNFRKKMLSLDILEPTELRRTGERARPAMLYRAREREMRIIPLFK
jgi:8-oxo-dGTP diphosphatase